MIVKGLAGQAYQLEETPFSSGGEGEIFSVFGDATKVVKIYHADRITKELEEKLKLMVDNPPNASILSQVAWPLDVVYEDCTHQFCGFVMPKLSITAELSEVYVYPPRTNITYI